MTEESMRKKPTDRRYVKTEQAIRGAFKRLIDEHGVVSAVTVSAISREANIDRKTFYLHYQSIDDLLDTVAQEETDQLIKRIEEELAKYSGDIDGEVLLVNIGRIIEDEVISYRQPIARESIDNLMHRFEKPLTYVLVHHGFALDGNTEDAMALKYGGAFVVAGFLTVLKHRLLEGDDTPIEKIMKSAWMMMQNIMQLPVEQMRTKESGNDE